MSITFNQFGLRDELVESVEEMGFDSPTPIQEAAIPLLINGETDIIALAQTGTGKTAAFGLPILHRLDMRQKRAQALILSPTRELCMQIRDEMEKYGQYLNPNIVAVYGGASISGQIKDIKRGVHIIVATPGRLIDLLDRKVVNLEEVETVVLDEADEMLNMGFRDDIETILSQATNRNEAWLFSATMNRDVRRIAKRFMDDPKEIAVAKENIGNENIEHQYFVTQARHRFDALKRLLDFTPEIYGIIFTRTKQDAHDISEQLLKDGYMVSALHGDLDQRMRTKVMNRFKNKQLQVIVATDVAARGIDVNDITHVINYELPDDLEVYTHRSGRTARAGKSGICLSIITPREASKIRRIEKMVNKPFHKSEIPGGEAIIKKRLFHFLESVENIEPQNDFAAVYRKTVHQKLDKLTKDELIDKLLWMQLQGTIEAYSDAPELNSATVSDDRKGGRGDSDASFGGRSRKGGKTSRELSGEDIRLFINIGKKDGLTPKKLAAYIADTINFDYKSIDCITIKDLNSFFNVPKNSVDYVMKALSKLKYNNRKIRMEVAGKDPIENKAPNTDRRKSNDDRPRDKFKKRKR